MRGISNVVTRSPPSEAATAASRTSSTAAPARVCNRQPRQLAAPLRLVPVRQPQRPGRRRARRRTRRRAAPARSCSSVSTVYEGPGRSTSACETSSQSVRPRPRARTSGSARSLPGSCSIVRCGASPTGISTTRSSPSCQSLLRATMCPMCGGLKAPPRIPSAACLPAHLARAADDVLRRWSARASAIGPRAWSFWVELPISAPMPNSPPSVKRVDAFTYTQAASTPPVKASAAPRRRHDRLRVPGAVTVDVVDRLLEAVHHLDRHLEAEVLRVPVLLGRVHEPVAVARPRATACARVHDAARRPRRAASPNSSGSTAGAIVRVDQQRLRRVAHAGALHLRVVGDLLRHRGVGARHRRIRGSCRRPRRSRARSRCPSGPASGLRRRAG